ncbi:hypothetical protein BS47DRAFT_1114720 [Hydnum rufescens UP504]|uniref:DUF6534 domain-containing protein n=1 Tax=Hydnum rufescens UP504 TaxID=1448309 RepID=A0A9P6AU61_9AGAM|nr:hypothetical protein BS47DRAFT_1114720 [Hydnum rufescens UP504]
MELETKHNLEITLGPALDNTLGAMLVSIIVSASLFGVLTTQCHYYVIRFKQDPIWLKCIVAALWIIDSIHQIGVSAMIFQYNVNHYGDFEYLRQSSWLVSVCGILEPLPAFIVQIYFTRRLYYLNRKLWPVAAFTAILSIISFAMGEASSILTFTFSRFTEYTRNTWLVIIWLITCSVCDIAIAISVAWTLYTSCTGFKQTDVLLARLILWIVTTGALPVSFALLQVVTFMVMNESLIHLAANIVLIKLYSNTLLASLNRWDSLTKGRQGALHLLDNRALSHAGLHPLLSLKKNPPASNKDGLHQIQINVTTHQY